MSDAIIVGIVSPLVGALIYGFKKGVDYFIEKKKKKKDPIIANLTADKLIYEFLSEMLEKYNADRSYLIKFHNGGEYYTGNKIQKFSRSHEVVREGISSEKINLQNIHISLFPIWLETVINNKYFFTDIENMDDKYSEFYLKSLGIKSIINIPMYINDRLVAVFGLEWVCDNYELNFTKYQLLQKEIETLKVLIKNYNG